STHDRSQESLTPSQASAPSRPLGGALPPDEPRPHDERPEDKPRPEGEALPNDQPWLPGDDPLPEALKDSDGSVRRAAVEAISRRNDPNDTPLLLLALT